MVIELQYGKCYIDGRGEKIGPMVENPGAFKRTFPFKCKSSGETFTAYGGYRIGGQNSLDLIAEWAEPTFKDVGTLAEIGAKVGDVVLYAVGDAKPDNQERTLSAKTEDGRWFFEDQVPGGSSSVFENGPWRIIRRADQPASAGPVVTETITRKIIMPGTYGRVKVTSAMYVHVNSMKTADEITAAIATLTEIRDAMQEAGE